MAEVNSNLGKDKEELKKQIQKYWSENVPGLDKAIEQFKPGTLDFYKSVDSYRYHNESYLPPLLDSVAESGKKVLEIGFGLGTDLRYFSKKGMNTFGVDLSFSNAAFANKGFAVARLKGKAFTADAENLPFKNESFDLVYSCGVLHHTPDTRKAIEEIHRVLMKNGKILIILYHKGLAYRWISLQYLLKRLWGHKTSKEDLITKKYDHTPLSKMYSKEEARLMFSKFKNIEINFATFGGVKESKKLWWIYYLLNAFPFLMNKLGSFLIIKAKNDTL